MQNPKRFYAYKQNFENIATKFHPTRRRAC